MNSTEKRQTYRIGEIYLMKFGGSGSEQHGWRPGLIFQNNTGNDHSPNVIALPLTSCLKKLNQPTHVLLPAEECGLPKDSLVLCENPERMSKERIGRFLTKLDDGYMSMVAVASLLATSAIAFIQPELLTAIWKKAAELNAEAA